MASGATLIVPSDQYLYLFRAIEAAQPGDTVRVLPGEFYAGYALLKDDLSIIGSGASRTIVRESTHDSVSTFKAQSVRGVLIEGLTIFGSRGDRPTPNTGPYGGALSCIASDVTIRDCIIARGVLGGVSTFEGYGGAIYASAGSSLSLVDCVLRDNYAECGGAIYGSAESSVTVADCVFRENCAKRGGAVYLVGYPSQSSLRMTGCVFQSNSAPGLGGAVRIDGEGDVVMGDCRFVGNRGGAGGAIYCGAGARVIMNRCVVAGNTAADGEGGGIAAWDCDFTATDCLVANNVSWVEYSWPGGAGIFSSNGSMALRHCTVSGNEALGSYRVRGGGVFSDGSAGAITNCIFSDNTDDISFTTNAELNVSYCDIEDMFPGVGIIHEPPRFVDPENGDFRLLGDSPCIDRGNGDADIIPLTDIEGKPRVIFGGKFERPDLGAYEYDPSLPVQICTQSLGSAIGDHEYQLDLKATGGFAPYSWFLLSGWLPTGLELSQDGILSGVPARPGNYDLTLLVANLEGQAHQRTYQLEVSGYEDWYVDASVGSPGEGKSPDTAFASVQDAVYAAGKGDIVHVAPGEYTGPIDVYVPIDIIGPGPDQAAIDGQQNGSAISFWLLPFGRLSGFKITNGSAREGGGLFLYESGITVENCVVESNRAGYLGGGIYAYCSPAKIENCIVRNNVSAFLTEVDVGAGGGIYCYFSPVKIDRCIVENNGIYSQWGNTHWGGGLALHGSRPVVTNCVIAKNYLDTRLDRYARGAGVFALFGSPVIINCTIADNYVKRTGLAYDVGGIGAMDCWASVTNCIIWGNGIDLLDAPAEFSVVGTPPEWAEGPGNISLDPKFVDPASGDYRLKDTSPCIDAARNLYIEDYETDLDGNVRILNGLVDMGAYENAKHEFGRLVIGSDADSMRLTWNSLPGETYVIETSTDLLHWEVAANESSSGIYTGWLCGENLFSPTFYRVSRMAP